MRQMWLGRGTAQRVNRLIASLELWAASRSHDAGKMVAAVESVRRYGLQHPLLQELTDDVEHIQKAHKRAEEQKRDEVREQLLERAAQLAPGNSDSLANLEHTIDRAERYGVEENLVLSVYSQLKMAKCEQELDEAMQLRSIRHLEIAIDQAAECGGVARVKVRAAERVLEEEHHIKKVFKLLPGNPAVAWTETARSLLLRGALSDTTGPLRRRWLSHSGSCVPGLMPVKGV